MIHLPAKLCAISFQGNASNRLQQDAFFFVDDWHQLTLGKTPIITCDHQFCIAVADGVSQSPYAEVASLATVKAVANEWQAYLAKPTDQTPVMRIERIYEKVANAPRKYYGASATLALLYRPVNQPHQIVIKHIGDSRVYRQRDGKWQCLTRDHNVLNEILAENAQRQGQTLDISDYNRAGYAQSLYALTDCLTIDSDADCNPMPAYDSQAVTIQSGDCFVVCTDGVHDLVPCNAWQVIDKATDLQDWLKNLRQQIYQSPGRAYDNATAVVVYFG